MGDDNKITIGDEILPSPFICEHNTDVVCGCESVTIGSDGSTHESTAMHGFDNEILTMFLGEEGDSDDQTNDDQDPSTKSTD